MKRKLWISGGLTLLALTLVGGAFMAARLLASGLGEFGAGDRPTIRIGSRDGSVVEAEWVRAPELPDGDPDVFGVFRRRQDNSIFVEETEGGFVLSPGEDGSITVSNATGKICEVVVTGETAIYVDVTLENIDSALSDAESEGILYQTLRPGTVEEIGELSLVRAWGEMRGDRLIASLLVYNRPPVISR